MPVDDEREKIDENSMYEGGPRYVVFCHPGNVDVVSRHTSLPVRANPYVQERDEQGQVVSYEVDLHLLWPEYLLLPCSARSPSNADGPDQ